LGLLAWLTESGCTHVAMEATGVYWEPVWNILSDGTFERCWPRRRTSRTFPVARQTTSPGRSTLCPAPRGTQPNL
jgi:hypothetical protein